MPFEIRTLTDDELPRAVAISGYAFNAPRDLTIDERAARARKANKPDWYLGTFEDSAMTSMMVMMPVEMYLNGAAIPFGAVSPVATAPEHRRKGHAGQMLRHSLELMRDRGQVISGLTTPHPALYRRYGWEIAADRRLYAFPPKDFVPTSKPEHRGSFEMLTSKDWPLLTKSSTSTPNATTGLFAAASTHGPCISWTCRGTRSATSCCGGTKLASRRVTPCTTSPRVARTKAR